MSGNILGGCLFESVLTIWCSSLLEDAKEFSKLRLSIVAYMNHVFNTHMKIIYAMAD